MNQWRKLIRQKAAKGGRLSPEEQRGLDEVRGDEITRRAISLEAMTLQDRMRSMEAAIRKAFNLAR
ncbi:hypothetical protein [Devosia sp. SL43]|uniref:hypothetical protein n=1 Tax=Devosia sp. SL43 TaxID=2806348 RepID=UPI001F27811C|nr:hypothetical protein [Devosia sp. SL43]UJW87939.1 hypothetical protein IM737_20510 [Devosia sp. SL43]